MLIFSFWYLGHLWFKSGLGIYQVSMKYGISGNVLFLVTGYKYSSFEEDLWIELQ